MNCKCGNSARYINSLGEFCCAICPLKEGLDSVKLASVPDLLKWCRDFLDIYYEGIMDTYGGYDVEILKDAIGRKNVGPL
jgi:hypothetical protein